MDPACPAVLDLARCRGLGPYLRARVLGQDEALAALGDAILAGELGHTLPGRPRSFVLILGPTGTGKTKAVLEASEHLFGTRAVARINVAEFASADRVPLLLGTAGGDRGILGRELDALRRAGGRLLLLDEIEKGHRSVSDLFLGLEAAEVTLACGETLDLSDLHILVTSNLGTGEAIGLEDVAYASLRRYVEGEASYHFRPEVFARFTAVVVFRPLSREVQFALCRQLLADEVAFQSAVLSRRFGHPHAVSLGPGVYRRLVNEGYHRTLGARPMRNVVERRMRSALVAAQLDGTLGPGMAACRVELDPAGGLRALGLALGGEAHALGGGGDKVVVD